MNTKRYDGYRAYQYLEPGDYPQTELVPQLDRVCVTYVEEGKLRVKKVEELNDLKTTLRSTSTVVKADGELLA